MRPFLICVVAATTLFVGEGSSLAKIGASTVAKLRPTRARDLKVGDKLVFDAPFSYVHKPQLRVVRVDVGNDTTRVTTTHPWFVGTRVGTYPSSQMIPLVIPAKK